MGNCLCYESTSPVRDTFLPSSDSHLTQLYLQSSEKLIPKLKDLYYLIIQKTISQQSKIVIISENLEAENLEFFNRVLLECPYLKVLHLCQNSLGIQGALTLSYTLGELKYLESLTISQNSLSDEGIESICQSIPFIPTLKNLDLSQNDFTWIGGEKISEAIQDIDSLETLDITGNTISRRALEKISKVLNQKPNLQKFSFDEIYWVNNK